MVTNAEYNKAKNAVNDKYTAESIQNYTNAYNNYMKQGLSSSEALAKSKGLLVDKNTTPTNIPTQNTTQTTGSTVNKTNNSNATKVSGNTVLPEYQGSGNQNKVQTSYSNQGTGNYTYNPTSGYYEKNNNQNYNTIRDAWDSKTYEQQQELLKNNPSLKEGITKVGGTIKQSPYQNQGEGQYQYNPKTGYYEKQGSQGGNETPTNKGGWDYQDNSPERMAEIIRNLDDLSKSNPGLFSDYDTFYNAFIAGKGRSPEQEKVLNDYFNKMKQYNKYDNMSSDELGYLLAHGEPAEDYLSYLKYNDPQRYAEIQEARKKNENQIMNETYLNTVASQAGYDMGDSDFWKWNQEEMGYRDVNKDGLDDRLYHAPTAEELKLVDENNQYEQERAKLTDAYKWLQEDLTNQYPDADLSTIMLLTSDRGNKIQRALDTLAVNQTKVQGSLKYLQNERATMDDAGQNTINEIQKQYGMYYDYSPQGIAERAQAQYAATNVTLDQADNGTDTQKQMALDRVLSDYYDKYGSIIQRSKSQVINDVMAYAKKNGVSLSQALEENFLKPLRAKEGYATLNTVSGTSPKVSFEKVGDTGYVFTVNPDGTYSIETVGGAGVATNGYNFTDYTPITSSQLESGLNNFMSGHPLNSNGGQCGSFVNDYLESLGYGRLYTDPIDKKAAITNTNEPAVGSIAVMDSEKYPQYGHTAIVTAVDGDRVKLLESNWGDDKKVHERWVNKSDITHGYFNPSLSTPNGNASSDTSKGYDPLLKDFFETLPTKLTDQQWKKIKNMGYNERTFLTMRDNYLKDLSREPDDTTIKILDTLGKLIADYPGEWKLKSTMLGSDYADNKLGDYISNYDYIKNNLTMDNLVNLKSKGATFGSLTEGEWPKIETSASKLNKNKMSEAAFKAELLDIYNTYAKKAYFGEQTLDGIYKMYGGKGSSSGSQTIKPMKGMEQITNVTNNNGSIDFDAVWASLK